MHKIKKCKLAAIRIRQDEPFDIRRKFASFRDADSFLRKRCEKLFADEELTFSFSVRWQNRMSVAGSLVIDAGDAERDSIFREAVRSELMGRLLMPIASRNKHDMLMMVNSAVWQFDRLMQDKQNEDEAMMILFECEGFDSEACSRECAQLHEVVQIVDEYHPLLQEIFPEMSSWFNFIKTMCREGNMDDANAIESFTRRASKAITYAVQDDRDAFLEQKSRARKVFEAFCSTKEGAFVPATILGNGKKQIHHLYE